MGGNPNAVQIDPMQVASVVPVDHAVGVHHRYHVESEMVPQGISFLAVAQQKLKRPFARERTRRFPRMLSGYEKDSNFAAPNGDHRAGSARDGLA